VVNESDQARGKAIVQLAYLFTKDVPAHCVSKLTDVLIV
jgi:hypothetical protein